MACRAAMGMTADPMGTAAVTSAAMAATATVTTAAMTTPAMAATSVSERIGRDGRTADNQSDAQDSDVEEGRRFHGTIPLG